MMGEPKNTASKQRMVPEMSKISLASECVSITESDVVTVLDFQIFAALYTAL